MNVGESSKLNSNPEDRRESINSVKHETMSNSDISLAGSLPGTVIFETFV